MPARPTRPVPNTAGSNAARPRAMNAPSISTSLWAKLIIVRMP